MTGHPRKKIEIIVEAPLQRAVLDWLAGQGVKGWSLLPRVTGGGQHGERSGDNVTRTFDNVMIVAIAAGQQPRLTLDPRVPVETMTAYIVQVSMGDTPAGTLEYRTIFVVGASLFVLTFAMNVLSRRIMRGRRTT